MQVILGSGGAIATPLAEALSEYTDYVRCVSRTPHPLPARSGTIYEHVAADLLDGPAVIEAVTGAEIVYVTVGIAYDIRAWRREWPVIIDNIIEACARAGARLAFFDSIYTLALTSYGNMTELSPVDPPSEKGAVRAGVIAKIWAAHKAGRLEATVARAADFYGPGSVNSLLNALVVDKLRAGDTAQWINNPDLPHSMTYTLDAGRHFALLANNDRAYGETWHLPTAPDPRTARQWVTTLAEGFGRPDKLQAIPGWLLWLLGRFNRQLREVYDVRHQTQLPYIFNSDKFEAAFGVSATPYAEGAAVVVSSGRVK